MFHTKRTLKLAVERVLICFLATQFGGNVEGGSFKSTQDFGFVRAKETLNSNATKDFRWSVWLTGGGISGESLYIGIASKLHRTNEFIGANDEDAIFVNPHYGNLWKGRTMVPSSMNQRTAIKAKSGDEIHFRFQPKLKKFSISIVS